MECCPTASVEVGKVAFPVASRVTVPKVASLSVKITLPVGMVVPFAVATVACRFAVCPATVVKGPL